MHNTTDLIKNLTKNELTLNSSFNFDCNRCGDCCKGRVDILLSFRDVYRIAKTLKKTAEEVVNRYCETYIGPSSKIPLLRLKPKGDKKICPLLKGNKCCVHENKPIVCALYPIGRIYFFENPFDDATGRVAYVNNATTCYSSHKKYKVREWLEKFNIPINDDFFFKWQKCIFNFSNFIYKLEKSDNKNIRIKNMVWSIMFAALYLNIDTREEVNSQFQSNVEEVLVILNDLESLLN